MILCFLAKKKHDFASEITFVRLVSQDRKTRGLKGSWLLLGSWLDNGQWSVGWWDNGHIYNIYNPLELRLRGFTIFLETKPTRSGWWLTYTPEAYDFVSWDYEIPNWMESHKIPWFQSTKQLYLTNHY